jgi:hypothetical protein
LKRTGDNVPQDVKELRAIRRLQKMREHVRQ